MLSYEATENFPKNEVYGLSSQLQRAAVSIPSNIAEGRHRNHRKEFVQFLSIAYGSLAELETHVMIAERLGYLNGNHKESLLDMTSEVGRMINGLKRSIEGKKGL